MASPTTNHISALRTEAENSLALALLLGKESALGKSYMEKAKALEAKANALEIQARTHAKQTAETVRISHN